MKLSSTARTTSRTTLAVAGDEPRAWLGAMQQAARQSLTAVQALPTQEPLDLSQLGAGASGAVKIARIAVGNLGDPEVWRVGQSAREIAGICQSFLDAVNRHKRTMPPEQLLRGWNACRSGLIRFYESLLAQG